MTSIAMGSSLIMGADLAGLAASGYELVQDQMLPVPGGTFTMGDDAFENESPAHPATVSAFRMSRTPVVNEPYKRWVQSLGERRSFLVGTDPKTGWPLVKAMGTEQGIGQYRDTMDVGKILEAVSAEPGAKITWGGLRAFVEEHFQIWHPNPFESPNGFDSPNQPVVNVDWYSAFLFAYMHGARPDTEAEWEYAASDGGRIREYDARDIHTGHAHRTSATVDVDDSIYPDGPFELRHMIGNVLGWKMDRWGRYSAEAQTDPTGPVNGNFRVWRGASWVIFRPAFRRVSFRDGLRPGGRSVDFGFRLVRPQDSQG